MLRTTLALFTALFLAAPSSATTTYVNTDMDPVRLLDLAARDDPAATGHWVAASAGYSDVAKRPKTFYTNVSSYESRYGSWASYVPIRAPFDIYHQHDRLNASMSEEVPVSSVPIPVLPGVGLAAGVAILYAVKKSGAR